MDNAKSKTGLNLLLAALLLGVNLVLFNTLMDRARVGRLDLTEGKHYSLTDVTKGLMEDLEEPGDITFYYSSPEFQHELLRPLIDPLRDLLSEFAAASDGRCKVRFVELDKAGKKEQEDVENAYGVRSNNIPVRGAFESGIKKTYFSVVISSGSEYEHFGLENLIKVVERGATDWEVELADIENLVAKALRKVARGFNSVPGALASRDKSAKITWWVTPDLLPEHIKGLKDTVTKVCEKLTKESGGRLELAIIDPYEGVPPEKQPARDKELFRSHMVRPIPVDILGEKVFHSWMQIEVGGEVDRFPLYTSSSSLGEADVKSDIEGSLKRIIPGYLPVVAVAAPEPPFNPMMAQMGRQPRSEFGYLQKTLGADYEVRSINLETAGEGGIPRNADALILIKPGDLSEKALFEIDQFVMRGGRLVVCADSFAFDSSMAEQMGTISVSKVENRKLADMLAAWGVNVLPQMVMDSRCEYFPIPDQPRYVGGQQVMLYREAAYPFFARLDPTALDAKHPITAGLPVAGLFWATPLEVGTVPEGVTAKPVIWSSKGSSTTDSTAQVTSILDTGYEPPESAKSHPLAVVLEGKFKSYFADKPIPGLDKPVEKKPDAANKADGEGGEKPAAATETKVPDEERLKGAPLKETRGTTSIVVVGDSDFLSPSVVRMFQLPNDVMEGNIRFLANALDYGGPGADMIAVRNRPPIRRPLEALKGLSPEQKESTAQWSFIWTCVLSVSAVILVAVWWMVLRSSQKPLALLPAEVATGKGGAS